MKKVCLVILDGFGIGKPDKSNAIWVAKKEKFFEKAEKYWPKTSLAAAGIAVGLPYGEPGNSETGHLNLGAGFVVYQYLQRINLAIKDGSFFKNPAFLAAASHTQKFNSSLHIMGLFSSGTVHSALDHLYALIKFAAQNKISPTWLHLFLDGRDAQPNEGLKLLKKLQDYINQFPNVKIATIIGRHFALDRDQNWTRTQKAYQALTTVIENKINDFESYLKNLYQKDISDEFVEPAQNYNYAQLSRIKDNDAVIFFDFREDSARQLSHAFLDKDFDKFLRKKIKNLFFVTMTEYEKKLPAHAAFFPLRVDWPLSRVLSEAGINQCHIAETDKYAHITYFFNGLKSKPFPKEKWQLIPSVPAPKFDERPEMSAYEVRDATINAIKTGHYGFILVNFANADMVGHTGNYHALIKAIEVLDDCLADIAASALKAEWILIVTADHGNAEESFNLYTGEPITEHTINPVPFYLLSKDFKIKKPPQDLYSRLPQGILADVAPTILEVMQIKKPASMTGQSLLRILKNQ